MKALTTICPPTLWGGAAVQIGKTQYQFDDQEQAKTFSAFEDIALIRKEITAVLSVRYFRMSDTVKFHNNILLQALELLHTWSINKDMPGLVLFLEHEAAAALDSLQIIASYGDRQTINQAKGLITLFIIKYSK